jgi:hypothetical protein
LVVEALVEHGGVDFRIGVGGGEGGEAFGGGDDGDDGDVGGRALALRRAMAWARDPPVASMGSRRKTRMDAAPGGSLQ